MDNIDRPKSKFEIRKFAKKFSIKPFEARNLINELKEFGIDPYQDHKDWAIDTEITSHTRTYLFGDISQAASKPDLLKTYLGLAWDCVKGIYTNQKDYDDNNDPSILLDLWGEARLAACILLDQVINSGIKMEHLVHLPLQCRSILTNKLLEYINTETIYGIEKDQSLFMNLLELPVDTETEVTSSLN